MVRAMLYLIRFDELIGGNENGDDEERCEEEQEEQEVLVIAIPEAVVDEWAVVVEQLHASVADRAVERGLALYYFTARAKVIQVQSDLQSHFNDFREIVVRS